MLKTVQYYSNKLLHKTKRIMFSVLKDQTVQKTITWRIIATATTFTLVFVLTNQIALASYSIGIDLVVKTLLYYFHEKLWVGLVHLLSIKVPAYSKKYPNIYSFFSKSERLFYYLLPVIKATSWRVIGSITTALVILIGTGELSTTLVGFGFDLLIKYVLYILHELAWQQPWRKNTKKRYTKLPNEK